MIGSRVLISCSPNSACYPDNGLKGVVEKIKPFRMFPYKVRFDNGGFGWFLKKHLIQ